MGKDKQHDEQKLKIQELEAEKATLKLDIVNLRAEAKFKDGESAGILRGVTFMLNREDKNHFQEVSEKIRLKIKEWFAECLSQAQ